jgi:O-antigen/teichoic acid export membrane protein
MTADGSCVMVGPPDPVAQPRPSEGLAARTVGGAAWLTLSIIGQRGLSLLSTLILARLIAPSAFGLLGMAMVLSAAMDSFNDLGTASALIQRKELNAQLASTLFWTNVLVGIVGAGFMVGVAPFVAKLYREPQVAPVLAALSVSFFINSLSVVQRAVLTRAMLFRRISTIQLSSSVASCAVGIGLAFAGAGVWSLIAAVTSQVTTVSVLYWLASPWRPSWHLSLRDLRSVTPYSANLTGSNFAHYFMRNMDNALIGRFLGAAALGYYAMAYGLMMYPLYNVTWSLGNVLFPALSRIQEEDARFRQAYLRALSVIATITFPLMLGLLATADLLVSTCFGAKWAPMVPIVRILAPVGMLQSITSAAGMIFTAKGRTNVQFRWALVEISVVLPAFVIGLRWGIIGVACGYAVAVFLLGYPLFTITSRIIGLHVSELARTLWPVMKNAVVMFAVVLLTRFGLPLLGVEKPWPVFGTTLAMGVVIYALLLLRSRSPAVRDVLGLLQLGGVPWLRRVAGL